MYTTIQAAHSYWAYLVLIVTFFAVINAIMGLVSKREYKPQDFRISLFTLIVTHLQLVLGMLIFFTSPLVAWFNEGVGMKEIMKDPTMRLYSVEHPLMMIITIALITIGYSKHKKKLTSTPKFKTLAIFYTLGFIALLSRIPWSSWF
ncbi:hypothetical protein [Aquimarina rhabdastrellae]